MNDIMIGIGECHLDSDDFASLYQLDFSLNMLQMLSGDCGGELAQLTMQVATAITSTNPTNLALISITADAVDCSR